MGQLSNPRCLKICLKVMFLNLQTHHLLKSDLENISSKTTETNPKRLKPFPNKKDLKNKNLHIKTIHYL